MAGVGVGAWEGLCLGRTRGRGLKEKHHRTRYSAWLLAILGRRSQGSHAGGEGNTTPPPPPRPSAKTWKPFFGKLQITPRLEGATGLIRFRNSPKNSPEDKHRDRGTRVKP